MFTFARPFVVATLSTAAVCSLLVPGAGARGRIGTPVPAVPVPRVAQHTGPGHRGTPSSMPSPRKGDRDDRRGKKWREPEGWWHERHGRLGDRDDKRWDRDDRKHRDHDDWKHRDRDDFRRDRRELRAERPRDDSWPMSWNAYWWQNFNNAGSNPSPNSLTANPSTPSTPASVSSSSYGGAAEYPYDTERESKLLREDRRHGDDKADEPRRLSRATGPRVSATEIYTGEPLNHLLDRLSALPEKARSRSTVLLDEGLLEQVNVAPPRGGNIGLFKKNGVLDWPAVFRSKPFASERNELDGLAEEAVHQATVRERVDQALLKRIDRAAGELEAKLKHELPRVPPSDYIRAKRFLKQLDQAVEALAREDVANYFNHTYQARGRTVAQLVENMARLDLHFAPATPGTEPAYRKLYQALQISVDSADDRVRE